MTRFVVIFATLLALLALTYAGLMGDIRKSVPGQGSVTKRMGLCPPPKKLTGNCTIDENVNCLTDAKCAEGQKCCREGCNKICKGMIAIPNDFPLPDMGIYNQWKDEKTKEWKQWAEESRKLMMERIAGLWEIATPNSDS